MPGKPLKLDRPATKLQRWYIKDLAARSGLEPRGVSTRREADVEAARHNAVLNEINARRVRR